MKRAIKMTSHPFKPWKRTDWIKGDFGLEADLIETVDMPLGRLYGIRHDRLLRKIREQNVYEWAETAIVPQFVRIGDTAFDIGANIGYYTALLHYLTGGRGRVHAFEANPITANLLSKSCTDNRWETVIVNNMAVSNSVGRMDVRKIDIRKAVEDIEFNLGGWNLREITQGGWNIEKTTIDSYVENIFLEKLHFIKIDVEGFENNVLLGASRSISRFKPYILIEFNARKLGDKQECIDRVGLLENLGYILNRVVKKPFPHFVPLEVKWSNSPRIFFSCIAIHRVRYEPYRLSFERLAGNIE